MADLEEIQVYTVNEYLFENKEDYEAALQEKKGIKYLSAQLDLNQTDKVISLYNEMIEKHVFQTPVGMDYLKKLRENVAAKNPDRLSDMRKIPVISTNHKAKNEVSKYVNNQAEARVEAMEAVVRKNKENRRTSLILNFVLAALVVVMFVISMTSSNVNILNYERVLQDKYAGWAEELSEKEERLKELENELGQKAVELSDTTEEQ